MKAITKKVKKKIKKKRTLKDMNDETGCQTEEAWDYMTSED